MKELTELEKVAQRIERDMERRDQLIRATKNKATRRQVAKAARLSAARIQQIVGIALLLVLVASDSASAGSTRHVTAVIGPTQLQRDVAVRVIWGPCPVASTDVSAGCAYAAERLVYVARDRGSAIARAVLWHERGHLFDYWALDDSERAAIAQAFGWTTWQPEHFADQFGACFLTTQGRHRGFPASLWNQTPWLCRAVHRFA